MNQRTIWGSQRGKWITLAAVVAILVALLAVGMVRAQDAAMMSERDYAENGTDPVVTLTAADPEERMVYWSLLRVADDAAAGVVADDFMDVDEFMITPSADGASASLSFKFPPDYEMPKGEPLTTANTNTYKVVVVAADDAPGAAVDGTDDIRKKTYHKLTVVVTDEDEDGSISLSALQPQVGVGLTATLMDDDAADSNENAADGKQIEATWKWEQAAAMSGPWTLISGETTDLYMPAADVVGMYLRATATYDDRHGDDKTAMAVSANAVRAVPSGTNSVPTFPVGADDNDRDVDENSPPGTNVGDPLKASDSPGEILTYTLTGTNAELYSIDRATGQISVSARTMLDREGLLDSSFQHTVMVTATDPYGPPDPADPLMTQSVTITINDVNEAPTVSGGPTRIKHQEGDTVIDLDSGTDDVEMPIYAATDAESTTEACTNNSEGSTCALSLEGPDAADFTIGDGTANGTAFGLLAFKNAPDFENPADADMDNVYEITVKVTDNGVDNKNKMSATRDVMITVDNFNEGGEVTFSSVQPKVGRPFTATLTDPDGMTTGVTWQWWKSIDDSLTTVPDFLDNDGNPITPLAGWEKIANAKSDTYKPVSGDIDRWLIAMATYTDPDGSDMAIDASDNAVAENTDNVAPEFREGGDKPVMQATRNIAENSVSDDQNPGDVGKPVAATDPNGDPDDPDNAEGRLTHTLSGPDKDSFEIEASSGQITVGADTELDYESNKKTYMVTVTATDPSQAMATIDVTIMVEDVNEAPEFTTEGDFTEDFRENGTRVIEDFNAQDPEKRQPVYFAKANADDISANAEQLDSTDNADESSFDITIDGKLTFVTPPDFENPTDMGDDGTYNVVIKASDDAPGAGLTDGDPIMHAFQKVSIEVTNVSESRRITFDRRVSLMDVELTASLSDGDATSEQITAATWQWFKNSVVLSGNGADTFSYTPQVTGSIKARATYVAQGASRNAEGTITVRSKPSDNSAPAFGEDDTTRIVDENKPATNVGARIVASDSDTLIYTLDDNSQVNFSIDNNGQLKTKGGLDYEDETTHAVTVTATDPSDASDSIVVTVNVRDVNEAPMITTGPTRRDYVEKMADETLESVATYTAPEEPDGDSVTWSLAGSDKDDFNIGEQDGELTFKEKPDFEKPVDANGDNIYMVTVEVSDGDETDTRQMAVTVTDVAEDGTVTLSAVQPKTGIDLMASLTDPDNVTSTDTDGRIEIGVTWQWWKSRQAGVGTVPDFLSDGNPITDLQSGWEKIADTKSDTYKPVSGDVGRWLTAMATYTDRRGAGNTMHMSSANAVIVNNDNVAPEFREGGDKPVMQATRNVAENSAVTDGGENPGHVGGPVMATDPNPSDLLTYTLSGPDMALFKITNDTDPDMRGGQISLNANTKLDYEGRTTYMVTVTAADPDGEIASVDVTIKVTDVNEAPMISTGPSIVGPAMSYYAENDMVAVASYEGAALNSPSWSLSGDDAEDFGISSDGMLTFNNTPDYEMPEDAGRNNVYDVTVKATDGTNPVMKNVKVMVTNVEELGTLSGDSSPSYEEGGEGAVGTYTASGGSMSDVANWSLMGDDMDDLSISTGGELTFDATPDFEMPMDQDMDNTYMVTVMAEAGGEMDTQDVMVRVTDVDEMGLTVTGRSSVDYMENRTDSVATYTAVGPDASMATWSLGGDDAGAFSISSAGGVLSFGSAPDYENPTDMGMDNMYMVTVMADDGTNMASRDVMVTVTDVDEATPMDLLTSYDANNNGEIDLDEVFTAIDDYFDYDDRLTLEEVFEIVDLYFEGS